VDDFVSCSALENKPVFGANLGQQNGVSSMSHEKKFFLLRLRKVD